MDKDEFETFRKDFVRFNDRLSKDPKLALELYSTIIFATYVKLFHKRFPKMTREEAEKKVEAFLGMDRKRWIDARVKEQLRKRCGHLMRP